MFQPVWTSWIFVPLDAQWGISSPSFPHRAFTLAPGKIKSALTKKAVHSNYVILNLMLTLCWHKLAFGARLFNFVSYAFGDVTRRFLRKGLSYEEIFSSYSTTGLDQVIPEVGSHCGSEATSEKTATYLKSKHQFEDRTVFKRTRTFSKFWLIFRKESTECRN